jgi:hypothetical protein
VSLVRFRAPASSGEFEKGLEISYGPNAAILSGYVYLAGRVAGKQPPTAPLKLG